MRLDSKHRSLCADARQFPTAISAWQGLDNELPRLPRYVKHAAIVAEALQQAFAETLSWHRVRPAPPHTHQFAVWLPFSADVLTEAELRLEQETRTGLFRRWAATDMPDVAKTEVTVSAAALDWTADDITATVRTFVSYLHAPRGERAS